MATHSMPRFVLPKTLAKQLNSCASKADKEFTIHIQLREEAETRLKSGTAPKNSGHALGQDALALLYRLSSDPASAGDALKLLHELQVHQVELELQLHQIETNEREFAGTAKRFQTLYDSAPFAYFVVDRDGKIVRSNRMGAQLTDVDTDKLSRHSIYDFLTLESRLKLTALLDQANENPKTVEVLLDRPNRVSCKLLITATLSQPTPDILLACCEYPEPEQA